MEAHSAPVDDHLGPAFSAQRARGAWARDRAALATLAGAALAVLWRAGSLVIGRSLWHSACVASFLVDLACLAWLLLAPASWRRWRTLAAAVARLAALPVPLALLLAGSDSPGRLPPPGSALGSWAEGPPPPFQAALFVIFGTGTFTLALCATGLQLPPVLSAALQAVSTVGLIAGTNPAHCSAPYLRHPQAAARMGAAYRILRPLIAPLEPLLWLAHSGSGFANRRCCSVLAALQFWGGCVLPLLLVAAEEVRAYTPHRLARLQRLLLAVRRQERQESRYWTRAAAERRRREAARMGLDARSLSSSSSGPSSPDSAAEVETTALQAKALMEAQAPPGLVSPGTADAQYELQYQAGVWLGRHGAAASLFALSALCLLYAWHLANFP